MSTRIMRNQIKLVQVIMPVTLCVSACDCEWRREDVSFVQLCIVSIDTDLAKKERNIYYYCAPVDCISNKDVSEDHAPGVVVCALLVAAAAGGRGRSRRSRRSGNHCEEGEIVRQSRKCDLSTWRIVVTSWCCCALVSRPRVRLPGGIWLMLPLRCGRDPVYSSFLHGFSSFWPETSRFVLVGAEEVPICYVLALTSSPGGCWGGMSLDREEDAADDTAGGKRHHECL